MILNSRHFCLRVVQFLPIKDGDSTGEAIELPGQLNKVSSERFLINFGNGEMAHCKLYIWGYALLYENKHTRAGAVYGLEALYNVLHNYLRIQKVSFDFYIFLMVTDTHLVPKDTLNNYF